MAEPMDIVLAFHNAFRRDMSVIDAAALDSARGKPGLAAQVERFRFFNEMLVWHANGEEQAIFPALELVAPSVAEAYERDHRGLDAAFDALSKAVTAHDALETARATAAFKFHLDIHLGKEDAHLYRLVKERVPMPDQLKALGIMAGAIPQARFPEATAWLFPLLDNDDRELVLGTWQKMMPPPVFSQVKQLAQKALGSEWAELVRRNPTLA
jgi:hypothetical protein